MKKIFPLFAFAIGLVVVSLNPLKAQSVAINTDGTTAHTSAILDIKSTTKGMLAPRMTTAQRTAITTPGTGLFVYDTDTNSFWFYNGSAWSNLSLSGTSGWLLTGNSGINPANNFIGTTDNLPLRFRLNNTWAGELNPLSGNVYLGFRAGHQTFGSYSNVAIGIDALNVNTTRSNLVAIGDSALYNNGTGASVTLDATLNTAVGSKALYANSIGYGNTAHGFQTLYSNTKGTNNTAIGTSALYSNTTAGKNTAIGTNALYTQSFSFQNQAWQSYNVAIGSEALYYNQPTAGNNGVNNTAVGSLALRANTSGYANTAIGRNALLSNTTGAQNTAIGLSALSTQSYNPGGAWVSANTAVGFEALFSNQSTSTSDGINNTAVGHHALRTNTTGRENTALGSNALYTNSTGLVNTAIGNNALFSNTTGEFNTAIGTSSLYNNVAGLHATAIGYKAMYYANNSSTPFTNSNVAVGYQALEGSGNPSENTGNQNTAIGYQSLYNNSSGNYNTATGYQAMNNNTSGYYNSAYGNGALRTNSSGAQNTAMGYNTLFSNTNGSANVAIGNYALADNGAGFQNIAIGVSALTNNTTGNENTAIGTNALFNSNGNYNTAIGGYAFGSTTGSYNTAIGYNAGANNTSGISVTCIGRVANTSLGNFVNATAIGDNAIVNATDKVRIGSVTVNTIEGQVAYTWPSDGRFKENIKEDVKGLDFILKLQPVSYNFNRLKFAKHIREDITAERETKLVKKSEKRIVGFVAQDVEKIIQQTGFTSFDAVHAPTNETDNYSMSYAGFVVPLVKAVQEQQQIIENLQKQVEVAKAEIPMTIGKQQAIIEEQNKKIELLLKEIQLIKINLNKVVSN